MTPAGGILLLDKPLGLSSNAALQRVRRVYARIKAGHTGSLDPLATGMLPICLGEATKIAGELLAERKCYRFTVRLGVRTRTGDAEGEVVQTAPVPPLHAGDIGERARALLGRRMQIPPMYSALKRGGEPLYALARRGIEVERAPREIEVRELEALGVDGRDVDLRVVCSKGTYVRTLGEELAVLLGTCGHLVSLRREFVEPFEGERMWRLEELDVPGGPPPEAVLAADRAVPGMPAVHLDAAASARLRHGQTVAADPPATPESGPRRLYDERGRFFGLGELDATGCLRPRRIFLLPP